jgi:hypothetical protein
MSSKDQTKNVTPAVFAGNGNEESDVIQGPKLVPAMPKVPQQDVAGEIIAEVVSPKKPAGMEAVSAEVLETVIHVEGPEANGATSKFKSAFATAKTLFHRYKTPVLAGAGVIVGGLIVRALVNSNLVGPEVIETTDEPAYYDDAEHTDPTSEEI